MHLKDFFSPDAINLQLRGGSKDDILAELVGLLRMDERSSGTLLRIIQRRENLGSTGIGRGIAIPHGRVPALHKIVTVFARLDGAIDFEALDDEPVDLIFLLLAPEHAGADHLKALARISRLLREPSSIEKLRASKDRAAIYSVLTESAAHAA